MEAGCEQPVVPAEQQAEATVIAAPPAAETTGTAAAAVEKESSEDAKEKASAAIVGLADEHAETDADADSPLATGKTRGRAGPIVQSSPSPIDAKPLRHKRKTSPSKAVARNATTGQGARKRNFLVKQHLHLGLGLRLNKIYSEDELRSRCKGHSDTLAKLEKFLQDKSFLVKVAKGEDQATRKSDKRAKGEEQATRKVDKGAASKEKKEGNAKQRKKEEPARKKLRGEPKEPKFVVGQVVWATCSEPARPAKIVEISPGAHGKAATYKIRHLDQQGFEEGEKGEMYVESFKLEAVDVDHLLPLPQSAALDVMTATPSELIQETKVKCRDRRTLQQPPQPGDLVWVLEHGHMPWPGKIVGIGNNEHIVRVQLLGMQQPDMEDGTATDVPMDKLVPLHRADIPVLASLHAEVESHVAKVSNAAEDDANEAPSANIGEDIKSTEGVGTAQPTGGAIVPSASTDAATAVADTAVGAIPTADKAVTL